MTDGRSWTLLIDGYDPLSLNDRTHWARHAQLTSEWVGEVITLAKAERMPRLQRIRVELHAYPPVVRRRDRDNLVATLKPCIDGLVRAGVLPDDTPDRVDAPSPIIHQPEQLDPIHKRRWKWHLVVTEILDDDDQEAAAEGHDLPRLPAKRVAVRHAGRYIVRRHGCTGDRRPVPLRGLTDLPCEAARMNLDDMSPAAVLRAIARRPQINRPALDALRRVYDPPAVARGGTRNRRRQITNRTRSATR